MTNILVLANHYAVASARYMADAFQRLGCDVRHDGLPMGRNIWGLTIPPQYVWTPAPPEAGWMPDLILVMDSDTQVLDTAATYRTAYPGVPLAVYGVDGHVRDYRRPYIEKYFLAHRHASLMEWNDADMTWLPCAYDPVHFTPSPVPLEHRKYDVALLGVMYPERLELVDALQKAGLSVKWGTGLVYDGYKEAHHQARISLCHNIAGDLAQRVFESGAMRCAVVMKDCADIANPDTNAALRLSGFFRYWTLEEAVGICVELIRENPGLCEKGANEMYASCTPHTWDARGKVILDWLYGTSEPVLNPVPDDELPAMELSA